ncbi:putative HSP20-like chaperone [Rosa chinensis]|uniref:Putative HSP20-like chaperone n=1 Tax=Rosa chinensis TaxID=74649 RepID=A0A2P6SBK5_ROSCH|nr:inactive protein RESTRICTED TEV MOVEMENT 2 [Rosa chinensis]PRQ56060.1 putative HSP20-like chaperone [Rosa chinensis]
MAMRQRVGATNTRPRQSIRPTYEDFRPQFELKEEPEAHIIYVQLPGFLKEQVRITFVHAPGVIRVHGQRPLGNNRWSRFNETFPLPQNCHESKIHGKFHNGVLTITLPKEVPKVDPKEAAAAAKPIQETKPKAAAATEAKPQKVLEDDKVPLKEKDQIRAPPSQKPAATAARDEKQKDKISIPSKDPRVAAPPTQKPAVEPNLQKGQDAIHQTAIATAAKDPQVAVPEPKAQRDEKRVIALSSAASEPKPQKGRDEIPPKTMGDEKAKADYKKEVQDRNISEENEKPGEPKIAENVVDTPLSKMTGERSTEEAVIERFAPNTLDKIKMKSKRFGSAVGEEVCNSAKQGIKNLDKWVNNEEKQLLINVGAAVLVLVAFGAYTTYNLWSPSGKPKN